jgi:2-amino-4-hydroxy-6-hydroxymethyldihydropteridine diphosphokinase
VAIVGVGANLGARWATLNAAAQLAAGRGLTLERQASVYETPALVPEGEPAGPPFLNTAWRVRFAGSAAALLTTLLRLERQLGRDRTAGRWSARTLDLDLLWLQTEGRDVRVDLPQLRVPHPALRARPFALAPLLDVAPELDRLHRHLWTRPRRLHGPPDTPEEARAAELSRTLRSTGHATTGWRCVVLRAGAPVPADWATAAVTVQHTGQDEIRYLVGSTKRDCRFG